MPWLGLALLLTLGGQPCRADEKETAAKKAAPAFSAEQVRFFEKEVLPILEANCFRCHGKGKKLRGGLDLTSRAGLLKGGDLGPAVSTREPAKSLLLEAIRYKGDVLMPPTGQLPDKEIATLTRWVKEGTPWTPGADAVVKAPGEGFRLTEEHRNYWAYRPITRPAVPAVADRGWVRTPVDAFLLAKLEAAGLKPAGPADRVALIRRVYYDLIGLPPTPAEVDAFVGDDSPDAYERLVDRLLASPHYGEKWGRHWLDLVRYAETNGYERDGAKPNAWRYRDYVIRSINEDLPYDRFIREQLAGDELADRDRDSVIATGYYRLGIWQDEPVDALQSYYNELDDIVSTTSQAFLGMTVGCARCHDHKKDPIPQTDYYRFLAFFHDIEPYSKTRDVRSPFNQTDITTEALQAVYRERAARIEKEKESLAEQMRVIEQAGIVRMPAEDQRASEGPDRPVVLRKLPKFLTETERANYRDLRKRLAALRAEKFPDREFALSVNHCRVPPPQAHVLIRGSAQARGDPVEPGFPVVLHEQAPVIPTPGKDARTAGRRKVLADWIASEDNPLTARVLANRLWQHHFGRGIVPTTSDFGKLGEAPTHPELLDWLAGEFLAGGWQIKRMHRLILLSGAYRMSSKAHEEGLSKDPGNRLYWRFNMRRLNAEEVRDTLLKVTGQFNPQMAGPSIYPVIPPEVLAGQSQPGSGWGKSPPEEAARRSVYVHIKRSLLVPVLEVHDAADTDSSCAGRFTTIVPTQALALLNGDFANAQARAFAARLRAEAPGDVEGQVRRAIRLTTGRVPAGEEVRADVSFIQTLRTEEKLGAEQALDAYCLLALNTNEFVYVD